MKKLIPVSFVLSSLLIGCNGENEIHNEVPTPQKIDNSLLSIKNKLNGVRVLDSYYDSFCGGSKSPVISTSNFDVSYNSDENLSKSDLNTGAKLIQVAFDDLMLDTRLDDTQDANYGNKLKVCLNYSDSDDNKKINIYIDKGNVVDSYFDSRFKLFKVIQENLVNGNAKEKIPAWYAEATAAYFSSYPLKKITSDELKNYINKNDTPFVNNNAESFVDYTMLTYLFDKGLSKDNIIDSIKIGKYGKGNIEKYIESHTSLPVSFDDLKNKSVFNEYIMAWLKSDEKESHIINGNSYPSIKKLIFNTQVDLNIDDGFEVEINSLDIFKYHESYLTSKVYYVYAASEDDENGNYITYGPIKIIQTDKVIPDIDLDKIMRNHKDESSHDLGKFDGIKDKKITALKFTSTPLGDDGFMNYIGKNKYLNVDTNEMVSILPDNDYYVYGYNYESTIDNINDGVTFFGPIKVVVKNGFIPPMTFKNVKSHHYDYKEKYESIYE